MQLKIKQLPSSVQKIIAAGEVIDRPASVVKELIENAIDAGATSIKIEIFKGGKEKIIVSDNGCGILSDQMENAVKNHFTSKIANSTDINSVLTRGYRGEALYSIASIAPLEIYSKPKDQEIGAHLSIDGKQYAMSLNAAMNAGTKVIVRDIFKYYPSRRKFLKSDFTEYKHVLGVVWKQALSTDVGFELVKDGKVVLRVRQCQSEPVEDSRTKNLSYFDRLSMKNSKEKGSTFSKDETFGIQSRINELFKIDPSQLFFIEYLGKEIKISGFLQKDQFVSIPKDHFIFVNGRPIQNKVIHSAIAACYREKFGSHFYKPFYVLYLTVPHDLIDINVHPQKLEIRFIDESNIYKLVNFVVKKELSQTEYLPAGQAGRILNREYSNKIQSSKSQSSIPVSNKSIFGSRQSDFDQSQFTSDHGGQYFAKSHQLLAFPFASNSFSRPLVSPLTKNNSNLFQLAKTFIIELKDDELTIYDQHALHEAMIFSELEKKKLETESLLFPEEIECESAEEMEKIMIILQQLNIEYGIQKARSTKHKIRNKSKILIKQIPQILYKTHFIHEMKNIIDDLDSEELLSNVKRHIKKIRSYIACRSAIMKGKELKLEEMQSLLSKAHSMQPFPFLCPHGRPVMREFEGKDLEKFFLR